MASHLWASVVVVLYLYFGTITGFETCGTELKLKSINQIFSFSSPGFPNPYPGNTQCRWKFSSPENSIIKLHCPDFEVREDIRGCLDLFYFFGNTEKGIDTPICSGLRRSTGLRKSTATNYMEVYFSSSVYFNASQKIAKGFNCTVTVLEKDIPKDQVIDCGKENLKSRIINGSEAEVHSWPWQVLLRQRKSGHYIGPIDHKSIVEKHYHKPICGGSLISSTWVLTAAHCVDGETSDGILVVLGEHDMDTGLETNHTVERQVSKIIVHSAYIKGWQSNSINDIAVLQLARPVEYSQEIRPVCLPTNSRDKTFDGESAIATGWGITLAGDGWWYWNKDLLEVNLTIITNAKCTSDYTQEIYKDQICAYEEGKDTCKGDSGGPLVWKNGNNRYQQIGIVSWGEGCAQKDKPGVYVRVTSYIDWIEEKTNTRFSYRNNC